MKFKKIYIEITNSCNKKCSFCSTSMRKKQEINLYDFESIIQQVKKYTNYIYLHVKGEPLLHSQFKNIISLCDKYEMKVNITTNGSYLSKQKDIIASSKSIRQINISMHAINNIEETNNILDTVEYIKKRKQIYFVYRYWILKDNLILKNNPIINRVIESYNLSLEKQKEIEENGNIEIDDFTYINKDIEFNWPTLKTKENNETGPCNGLKTHVSILSDGTVVPCCLDGEGIINLGNIHNQTLGEILNNERTINMIKAFHNNKRCEDLCRHCNFKK